MDPRQSSKIFLAKILILSSTNLLSVSLFVLRCVNPVVHIPASELIQGVMTWFGKSKITADKTANRLKESQVTVTIAQYAPRKVYVGGDRVSGIM